MGLVVEHITKRYGSLLAVDDVTLTAKEGELVALLGPSGCGKTTLLRVIAGLIEHDGGSIFINGKDKTTLPAQKRNTALVFQNYALFPHLNVYENIAYGLKAKKYQRKLIEKKVNDALEYVQLKGRERHKIQELSGGQQQRVALARALVIEPDILLFDEPLSNLDEKLRVTMRQEIKRIQQELGITSVYVTHDQEEALSIADKIAVMNEGKIEQFGQPDQIYHNPRNTFVADFIGHANLLTLEVNANTQDTVIAELWGKTLELKLPNAKQAKSIRCLLRPEVINIGAKHGNPGVITWEENLGNIKRYTVKLDTTEIRVDTLNRGDTRLNVGDQVCVNFSPRDLKVLDWY